MSHAERFVGRGIVNERYVGVISAVAGAIAAFAGARPTGAALVDIPLVAAGVAAVVWASASAPWWTPTLAAGVGATIALDPVLTVVGAAAFGLGLFVGIRQRNKSELQALVAAIAMNVLIRSEVGGFLGLSALIGCGLGLMLFVLGARRRPSGVRRVAGIASMSAVGIAFVALLGLTASGVSARDDLSQGARQARQAITVLNAGDYEEAARLFESSSVAFARSDDRLGGAPALPSRLIPGVAQNVRAGADLAAAAATGTAEAAEALRAIDPDSLRVIDGRIDLEAVAAVEDPLLRVQAVLDDLQATSAAAASPWLLPPVQDELDDLDERLESNEPRLVNAIEAVRLSPQMLGAGEARRYLIMFTTPAELRGITGFFGNYADVIVDDGQVEVTEFGRASELRNFVTENGATCTGCPQEFVDGYGQYSLAVGLEREFLRFGWQNITMPAHFPYVAEAASIIYPQSGGVPIDGVIAMDPYVIQALMRYTGPVALPELGVSVFPDDAAQFILEDQYVLAGDDGRVDRIDALETIGQQVIESLLTAALPAPSELARDLGPLTAEQRLLVWTADPDEQALLERINMLGALPEMGDDGGFGLTVVNGGNNKIDVFLERDTDVRIETGPDGQRLLVADVTLRNTAPGSGLPQYVIGNSFELPEGTSRMLVTAYGPAGLRSVLRDGEPVNVGAFSEAGWTGHSRYEDVLPGESVTLRYEFVLGAAVDDVDAPVEWLQPLSDRP